MPKPSRNALVWSDESQQYQLHTQGQPVQWFRPGEEATFSRWLEAHTSFAFVGHAGRLSMLNEARSRDRNELLILMEWDELEKPASLRNLKICAR